MSKKSKLYFYRQALPTVEEINKWKVGKFVFIWNRNHGKDEPEYLLRWIGEVGLMEIDIPLEKNDYLMLSSRFKWHPDEWRPPYKIPLDLSYKATKGPRRPGITDCPNYYRIQVVTDLTIRPVSRLLRDDEFAYIRTKRVFDDIFEYVPKQIPPPTAAPASNRKESV